MIQKTREQFIRLFEKEPLIVVSPGRINLIGEHTDYNDGFVLPAAIDKKIVYEKMRSVDKNISKKEMVQKLLIEVTKKDE